MSEIKNRRWVFEVMSWFSIEEWEAMLQSKRTIDKHWSDQSVLEVLEERNYWYQKQLIAGPAHKPYSADPAILTYHAWVDYLDGERDRDIWYEVQIWKYLPPIFTLGTPKGSITTMIYRRQDDEKTLIFKRTKSWKQHKWNKMVKECREELGYSSNST